MSFSGKVLTKAISDKAVKSDGFRFLIVQANLGYKPVERKSYLTVLEELIPSESLLTKWKSRKINWSKFAFEYKKELIANPKAQDKIHELQELVKQGQTITLLCYESEWRRDDCHRSILSDVILNRDVEYDGHLDMTAAEILSYIPKQKKLVDQEVLEAQLNLITEKSPEHCYYCPKNNFEDKAAYEKHMVLRHPKKVSYPSILDLITLNIKAQGCPWEC